MSARPPPQERGDTYVGRLARRLGIRPTTLRKWEAAGLVRPRRDPHTGYRVCSACDVRDARLVHQLRRGGYLLAQIAPVIDQIRTAGGVAPAGGDAARWARSALRPQPGHAHRRGSLERLPRRPAARHPRPTGFTRLADPAFRRSRPPAGANRDAPGVPRFGNVMAYPLKFLSVTGERARGDKRT
ncbi:MerR family transcriptional regulator [Mangrovihabitans endophyticus]|uniref:MerR family transcriptional regulator n=1 Tax=Mangrovihabitans endophyticus TaxID=1751298 RepID=UPI0035714C9C